MSPNKFIEYDIIIVGSGLSGYTLAKEIRKLSQSVKVLIVTAENGEFYSKPLLSTGITKNKTAEDLSVSDASEMATQLNASIMSNTVVEKINIEQKTILIGKEEYHYQKLVLATGANCNTLDFPGFDSKKVLSVNNLNDYRIYRELVKPKDRVAIMGAGLIGCEFANDLIAYECEVKIIEPSNSALNGLIPEIAGNALALGLAKDGIDFKFKDYVEAITEREDCLLVELASGSALEADLVISAVGLKPNINLAKSAGIKCQRGVEVNRNLQTSESDVFALGDCAEVDGKVLSYVLPLMACARALAKTLTGATTPVNYGVMPIATKTPSCPVVIYPPESDSGQWEFEGTGQNIRGLFKQEDNTLGGFVLTGEYTTEKQALSKIAVPIHRE